MGRGPAKPKFALLGGHTSDANRGWDNYLASFTKLEHAQSYAEGWLASCTLGQWVQIVDLSTLKIVKIYSK